MKNHLHMSKIVLMDWYMMLGLTNPSRRILWKQKFDVLKCGERKIINLFKTNFKSPRRSRLSKLIFLGQVVSVEHLDATNCLWRTVKIFRVVFLYFPNDSISLRLTIQPSKGTKLSDSGTIQPIKFEFTRPQMIWQEFYIIRCTWIDIITTAAV